VQYDPHLRSISFNREAARKITEKYRKEGLLAAFLEQLDLFAQETALAPDGQGGFQYDPVRHIAAVKDLLIPRAPGQPRVPGVRRERVTGSRYVAGSAIGNAYAKLKDEQEHNLGDFSFAAIRHLRWHGNRDKTWKIFVDGKSVRLKHAFPIA
jgi:hypothetical protein